MTTRLLYRVFSMGPVGKSWHGAIYDANRPRLAHGRPETRFAFVRGLGPKSSADAVAAEAEALGARPWLADTLGAHQDAQ